MSPHLQFMLAAAIGMGASSPTVILAWRQQLRHTALMTALYSIGFGLIAVTFVIDDRWNPPLFMHGFTPGIGIGLLLASLGLFLHEVRRTASSRRERASQVGATASTCASSLAPSPEEP